MLVSHEELLKILREWESRYWNMAFTKANQRAERFNIRWRVRVAVVNKFAPLPLEFDEGYVANISGTGLGLVSREIISVGDWCLCFLYPPDAEAPFVVMGQIAWQKPIGEFFATGLQFIAWQDEHDLEVALELARKEARG